MKSKRIALLLAVAIATSAACGSGGGGAIEGLGEDGGGGGDGGGGRDGGGAGDGARDGNVVGCPANAPAEGASCTGTATCSYGCDNGGPGTATCQAGKWTVSLTNQQCPPPGDGSSTACGSATCSPSEYCVTPCCGGPAPQCNPVPDSGTCPPGTQSSFCPGTGQPGCSEVCTPAPPYCTPSATPPSGCQLESGSRRFLCLCA